jgi:alpha-N-arabinofuranosidase
MYTVHHDAVMLPISVANAGWYVLGADSVRAVSASASRDKAGLMHVTMSNLDPVQSRTVTVDVRNAKVSAVSGRVLAGDAMDAYNTFERPERVKPVPFAGARVADGQLSVTIPAHAVLVLELK